MRPEPGQAEHPIAPAILSQAAEWLLRLHDDDGAAARAACARWCAEHPDHARAWQRAQHLLDLLGQVPPAVALPVLGRPRDAERRATLKRLGLWLTLAPGAWLGLQWVAAPGAGETLRTARGERRPVRLPDGSRVHLDTDTRLALHFDAGQRTLFLSRGQILVDTAADARLPPRPFQVRTAHGQVRALGTRFSVRIEDDRTQLALLDGGLEIRAGAAAAWRLAAGQQGWFDGDGGHGVTPLDDTVIAWTGGMLVADARPLREVLAELSRYRRGVLRCDPEVGALPVSGAFPLDAPERSLAMLEATYPVRVQRAAGGWWVTVAAR